MKQTAVEWLIKKRAEGDLCFSDFLKAKELEEQQKGYSDEEVENILIEYVKTNPTKPYRVVSWFQQFKKK